MCLFDCTSEAQIRSYEQVVQNKQVNQKDFFFATVLSHTSNTSLHIV